MVFVLGGPPGHGKTMAAQELSSILGKDKFDRDFLKVSCANVNSVHEVFVSSGSYRGSEVGSELNNFVVNHQDRVGIDNLDEFDRLKDDVLDGLYTIFDKGEWVNKRLSTAFQTKTLACRRIIWILTTNVFDDKIVTFHEKHRANFENCDWRAIDKNVKRAFRGPVEEKFGLPLSRRLGSLIPFVPFNIKEKVAIAEEMLDDYWVMYAKPPSKEAKEKGGKDAPTRLVGNFEFTIDHDVVAFLVDQCDEHKGATSIADVLRAEIINEIHDCHLEGEDLEHTKGRFSLIGSKGEEELKFNWPI